VSLHPEMDPADVAAIAGSPPTERDRMMDRVRVKYMYSTVHLLLSIITDPWLKTLNQQNLLTMDPNLLGEILQSLHGRDGYFSPKEKARRRTVNGG